MQSNLEIAVIIFYVFDNPISIYSIRFDCVQLIWRSIDIVLKLLSIYCGPININVDFACQHPPVSDSIMLLGHSAQL